MTSAADITVPGPRPSQAAVLTSASKAAEVNAVFDGIDELLAACRGAPYEDRLAALISACIDRGIDTRKRIVGAARCKGFNEAKAGRALTKGIGTLWRRGSGGTYTVIV